MMRPNINLSIATGINEMGGVATVINILNQGFYNNWNIRHITTHTNKNSIFNLNKLLVFTFSLARIIWYLIFYNIGIVHIHMSSRGSYLRKSFIVRLVKLFNAKIILHLHGAEFQQFYNDECSPKKQKHIRKTFDIADVIIVLSTQWSTWIKTIVRNPSKVQVVYNAVENLDIDRSKTEQGRILFLGRLGERKGVEDLINAFSIVLKKYPNARLTLGGDGDAVKFKQQAENLGISNNIDFLGWVSGTEKITWLSRADIYCLPSYNEGFPMGVLEAMSANIPVVASTAGGIPDAISDGTDGLLIEAGDVEKLAAHLKTLIGDRALNAQYSIVAKNKFIHNFSKQAVFPKLNNIYKELMSK